MQVITPFEFVERFPEKGTLAVVGNAPSVLEYGIGPEIDRHDIVVRFNECPLEGFEEHVGRRTTILVTNPYRETSKRPLLEGGRPELVLVISPQQRRGDGKAFEQWVGDCPVLFTYTPALVAVKDSTHFSGLTTGTYAMQLLWRLLGPERMLVTGFTMFSDARQSHYWQEGQSPGLRAHDMEEEGALFLRILNSIGSKVGVTPDIQQLSKRFGVPFERNVRPYRESKKSWWRRVAWRHSPAKV